MTRLSRHYRPDELAPAEEIQRVEGGFNWPFLCIFPLGLLCWVPIIVPIVIVAGWM